MKNLIIILLSLALCFQVACSMGSKHNTKRDMARTFYWASEKVGVFKTQTCQKYKGEGCEIWEAKTLDAINDWEFIKNSRMILVPESIFFDIL